MKQIHNPRIRITDSEARLTDHERVMMRAAVVSHIHAHPLSRGSTSPFQSVVSPFMMFAPMIRPLLSATLVFVLVFGSTTTVTLAAQTALPGSTLYPVKHLSEVVRQNLAVSPHAKVSIAALRAERRLAEVRALKEQHQLTPDVQAALQEEFTQHVAMITDVLSESNTEEFPLSETAQAVARIGANLDALDASEQPVLAYADTSPAAADMEVPIVAATLTEPIIEHASVALDVSAPEAIVAPMAASLKQVGDAVGQVEVIPQDETPTFEDIARATLAAHEDMVRMRIEQDGYDGIPDLAKAEVARAHAAIGDHAGADTILDTIGMSLEDDQSDPVEILKDVATINLLINN